MAYEKRSLRPFDAFDQVQKVFSRLLRIQSPPIPDGFQTPLGSMGEVPLGVAAGAIAASGGTLLLDRDEYMSAAIGLYFGVTDDDWREVTTSARQDLENVFGRTSTPPVELLVTAYNTRLKILAELLRKPMDEWLYSEWRHVLVKGGQAERPRPLKMPEDGCIIAVQFVLAADLPTDQRVSGRPWRKGSWLSRNEIRVSASKGSGLAPRPLTDNLRVSLGLGSETTMYVALSDGAEGLLRASDLSDHVSVFIDEDLLRAAMSQNERGQHLAPQGADLATRWAMDVFRTLIYAYATDQEIESFDLEDDEFRGSFLYSMLLQLRDAGLVSMEEGLLILRRETPRFVSLFEHVLRIRSTDRNLLGMRTAR
jgi:hypothetical protein